MTSSRDHLVLPHEHELSLVVASQASAMSLALPRGVTDCSVLSPGLVQLTLQAGDPEGYGSRSWPFLIGGAGLGDTVALFEGDYSRAPLAARFKVPIALHGIDDSGFCDGSFWEALGKEPSLLRVAQTAVSWLEGSHLKSERCSPDTKSQWANTEKHSREKLKVIRDYKSMVAPSSLVRANQILPEWIAPAFRFILSAQNETTQLPDWNSLVTEVSPGIFAFDLFTIEFCDALAKEVDSFEATSLPKRRPNTMNRLGLVVNEIGLEPIMTQLLERLLAPICKALFPNEMVVSVLDHHHSFCVQYNTTTHAGLDMHHDASEATLNVCLGKEFTGAGLRFCGQFGSGNHRSTQHVHQHVKGRAILHLGRHRHGADDIATGERINLIVWARNSAFRAAAAYGHVELDGAPMEKETLKPDLLCLSKANDRDYEEKVKLIEGKPLTPPDTQPRRTVF